MGIRIKHTLVSCVLSAGLLSAGCGDDDSGGGAGQAVACDPGFVAVAGECREVQDLNNSSDDNSDNSTDTPPIENPFPTNNLEVEPYSCDTEAVGTFAPLAADDCHLIAQDCEAAGEGCYVGVEGAVCLPPTEDAAGCGEPCDVANGCAPGQICAGEPMACLALCELEEPCPGSSVCAPLNGREDVGVCQLPSRRLCDVFDFEGVCGEGEGCYAIGGDLLCAAPTGDAGSAGEPCGAANGCEPGLICGGAEGQTTCRVPCRADGGADCPGDDDVCTPIRGFDPLGLCF